MRLEKTIRRTVFAVEGQNELNGKFKHYDFYVNHEFVSHTDQTEWETLEDILDSEIYHWEEADEYEID